MSQPTKKEFDEIINHAPAEKSMGEGVRPEREDIKHKDFKMPKNKQNTIKPEITDERRVRFDTGVSHPASQVSSEFLCKCKKQKGWITEGEYTMPCPNCGRKYFGYYDRKNSTIGAKEIK